MPDYCNITTDLQNVFSRIEEYQGREIVENWVVDSAPNNLYKKTGTGYLSAVYVDGSAFDLHATKAALLEQEEGAYYDSNEDALYIITDGGNDPDNHTVEVGIDWADFKEDMRDKAQQIMDAYLNNSYVTPLIPRSRQLHDTSNYEYPIVEATACITCALIMQRTAPDDPNARELMRRAWNANPEIGEDKGIINKLVDGDMMLQDQISPREIGSWNIYPYASNSIDFSPIIIGKYSGSTYLKVRVQIDTAGAVGTATFKLSWDGGTNWDLTLQKTADADNDTYRMSIGNGLYLYFPAATYGLNDYWDVELFPGSDTADITKIGSIRLTRR